MTFEWTTEQRCGLTFGSTVDLVADPDDVLSPGRLVIAGRGFDGISYVMVETPKRDACERLCHPTIEVLIRGLDPATLQPPSMGFIHELAQRRLGESRVFLRSRNVRIEWGRSSRMDGLTHDIVIGDTHEMCCFRAAVAAIHALAAAGLGKAGA